jgi:hypothetical protein
MSPSMRFVYFVLCCLSVILPPKGMRAVVVASTLALGVSILNLVSPTLHLSAVQAWALPHAVRCSLLGAYAIAAYTWGDTMAAPLSEKEPSRYHRARALYSDLAAVLILIVLVDEFLHLTIFR